jgi:hypothetical protein
MHGRIERFQEKLHDFSGSKTRRNKGLEHFTVSMKRQNALTAAASGRGAA